MTDKQNEDLDLSVDQSGDYDPTVPGSAPHMAEAKLVSELTQVDVPDGVSPGDVAAGLLAAAEDLGHPVGVVQAFEGSFLAPADVVDAAYPGGVDEDDDDEKPKRAPAKKAPAKAARK